MVSAPAQPNQSRRLFQDFVTAPVSMGVLLPRLARRPSPIPGLVAAAAHAGATAPSMAASADVRVLDERPRGEGWSIQLGWAQGALGLPGFDGELVVHDAAAEQTWIGLEGAVSLALSTHLSDRQLRAAQLQLRSLLMNFSLLLQGPLPTSSG